MKQETRGRPRKVTPELLAQMRLMRKEFTVFQIAPKVGLSRQTVFRALSKVPDEEKKHWVIGDNCGRGNRYKFLPETIHIFHELVGKGHSVNGIAQHLQVSRKSIANALKKHLPVFEKQE